MAPKPQIIKLVVLAALAAVAFVMLGFQTPSPGITLRFELYEAGVKKSDLFTRPDVVAAVFIRAVTPDGEAVVFSGPTRGSVHISAGALADVARNWTELLKARGHDPEDFFTALIVSLAVINKTSGKPLFYTTYFLDYHPAKVVRGDRELIYTLHIAKGRGEWRGHVVKVDREEKRGLFTSYSFTPLSMKLPYVEPPKDTWCEVVSPDPPAFICWYRKAWVGVENLTSVLPSTYFTTYNGKLYMKIPVIMAVNNYTYSGSVGVAIGTLPATSQVAVGAALAVPGDYGPSISLAGWSWGGRQYFLANGLFLGPTRSGWIWIWGRPVFASYDVYYEGVLGRDYIQEENYFYIADIYISGSTIVSGKDFGLPQEVANLFYGGVDKQQLVISNTALSDGALQPGEHIQFNEIFPYFDRCEADFEVGIPVGAVVLAVLARVPVPAVLPKDVFPGIDISLSIQGATMYVLGSIKNYGDHPDVPTDYNVPEYIYAAVSKYQYTATDIWGNTCLYQVPSGIYIEAR
ncbi:conserved hypothetical protein [Pyrobaculum islandicum DSM 4184]|uniref:Uncharacterized protein n=1 Tax=Pyrobaculum islandicum (strain DSM 4184 / JCM 9189 / GEO3) TaxID=384616 RepID=A1RRL8_PYRIL|nr:hypothetical protein [Pyrobaculum islandicum]ABL87600.1 conserved hypothetical protein [Pyrobaculum islandicum DSM 4184]